MGKGLGGFEDSNLLQSKRLFIHVINDGLFRLMQCLTTFWLVHLLRVLL